MSMKHYKDPSTNAVYAYESDGSQDSIIPSSFVAITDDEADAIRNPPLTPDQEKSLTNSNTRAKIVELEIIKQPRAIREAMLAGDNSRLVAINNEIEALRAQIVA